MNKVQISLAVFFFFLNMFMNKRKVQNLFMNSSNSICASSCDGHMENKKKSRKIRKNGNFFEGERHEERYGRGGIKCRDTGPSAGADCCCK